MSNLKLLQDGGTVIGNGDISDVVDKHLIETLRAEGGFDDVGEGKDSGDVLGSDILTLFSLTED